MPRVLAANDNVTQTGNPMVANSSEEVVRATQAVYGDEFGGAEVRHRFMADLAADSEDARREDGIGLLGDVDGGEGGVCGVGVDLVSHFTR